jgi:acyl carrier protein
MLNLETDMESDLGIDSIKKVEIMGALRSQFPNLPKADPEAFAEARTLGQIIDYMIKGEQVDAINNSAVEEQQPELSGPSITRGIVELKVLPEPDFSSFNLPKNHICILTDDGTPSTTILAKELFGRGWKVLVMSYPESIVAAKSSLPKGVERVTLIDLSEEHLQQKLVEIKTKYGPTAAFVHLNPSISNENNPELFSTIQMEIIKHVFLLAKHLKDQLTSAAVNGKSIFMVVTRMDGQFGLGNNMDFDPISGGLFGLVKSLNLEWGAVFCRGIDFNPNCSIEDTTAHILAELHDPNRLITEVAYNQHERTTLVVEQQGNEVKS